MSDEKLTRRRSYYSPNCVANTSCHVAAMRPTRDDDRMICRGPFVSSSALTNVR